jgi:hypothetical protein
MKAERGEYAKYSNGHSIEYGTAGYRRKHSRKLKALRN